jgi:hypothetical protein
MDSRLDAAQDVCLIAITDGQPVPAASLGQLPPWRAVLIARVAERAGIPLEGGSVAQLRAEAARVGGAGQLTWPPVHTETPGED